GGGGAMGGVVGWNTAGGGWSVFYVTLPFMMDFSLQTSQPVEEVPEAPASAPFVALRVLVVDDALDNRMLLQAYFEREGHRVTFAENGREAVDRCFGGDAFDLIIMDIQMPVMNGYEATRVIRGLEMAQGGGRTRGGGRTPIVALTAHAMAGERERCLEAGCDHFLTKPIKKNQFLAECYRVLKRGS
ncbi:MAG: response regulator, partial [Magnetococcales bacterium]|nr:response regulator [Magnetococcales bacterium]